MNVYGRIKCFTKSKKFCFGGVHPSNVSLFIISTNPLHVCLYQHTAITRQCSDAHPQVRGTDHPLSDTPLFTLLISMQCSFHPGVRIRQKVYSL